MTGVAGRKPRELGSELLAFVVAVFVGSLGGLATGQLLSGWAGATAAGAAALAAGTTLTGAAHARLVHGQSLRALIPRVVVAAPLAYIVMYGVHRLAAP